MDARTFYTILIYVKFNMLALMRAIHWICKSWNRSMLTQDGSSRNRNDLSL